MSVLSYVFIRICVAFLQSVAPFSIFYVLNNLLARPSLRLPRVLEIWCTLEAAFYLFFFLPYRAYRQRPANHPTLPSREHRQELFRRCHRNIPDPERYLAKWFRDAPVAEIKRENVKDFLRWAFLNMRHHDPAFDEELAEYVAELEKLLGRKLEPGYGKATCLRLTYDRVDMWHRSLTWYMVGQRKLMDLLLQIKVSWLIPLLVCICRRYDSIWPSTSLRLRFLPRLAHPVRLPSATLYTLDRPSVSCKDSDLLAPAAYSQEEVSSLVRPWHRHRAIPVHKLFSRPKGSG